RYDSLMTGSFIIRLECGRHVLPSSFRAPVAEYVWNTLGGKNRIDLSRDLVQGHRTIRFALIFGVSCGASDGHKIFLGNVHAGHSQVPLSSATVEPASVAGGGAGA